MMTREQIAALVDKVACASLGHDSLGQTGLVVHLTPEERDAIVAALNSTPMERPPIGDIDPTAGADPNFNWDGDG